MRTIADHLRKDDILRDGSIVVSRTDHDTTIAVVVRHAGGQLRIRDFDRGYSLEVARSRGAVFGPTGGHREAYENDLARRAEAGLPNLLDRT